MIQSHYKKANIFAGVWAITMVALMVLATQSEGNIWENNDYLAITFFLAYTISLVLALWFYAKAKGYWGILGAFLFLLSVLGLLILLALPDRLKNET